MSEKYHLPAKIPSYLDRLRLEYERSEDSILCEIIQNARIYVREGKSHRRGGQLKESYDFGYEIVLFLDQVNLGKIPISDEENYRRRIKEDLNSIKSITDEVIANVYLEPKNESDLEYKESIPMRNNVPANSDTLSSRQSNHIRLFISYCSKDKKEEVENLAKGLKKYRILTFVAHNTIKPAEAWPKTIIEGLKKMDIMLVCITKNFNDSVWTNQEIGFALGRNIPVIPLKLEKDQNPSGFIADKQALEANLKDVIEYVPQIYKIMMRLFKEKDRKECLECLRSALIDKFIASSKYVERNETLDFMDKTIDYLTKDEFKKIARGFSENPVLNTGYDYQYNKIKEQLRNFVARTTRQGCEIKGKEIILIPPP